MTNWVLLDELLPLEVLGPLLAGVAEAEKSGQTKPKLG